MSESTEKILLQVDIDNSALNQKLKDTIDQVNELTTTLATLTDQLKEAFKGGSVDDIQNLIEQVKEAEKELGTVTAAAQKYQKMIDDVTKSNDDATKSFKKLSDAISTTGTNLEQPVKSANTFMQVTKELSTNLQLAKNASNLFGDSAKGLQEVITKVQGTIDALRAAEELEMAIKEASATKTLVVNTAMKVWNGTLEVSKSLLKAVGIESEATAVIIRGALVATGIGIAIIAISELVTHWNDWFGAIKKVNDEQVNIIGTQKQFDEFNKQISDSLGTEIGQLETLYNRAKDETASKKDRIAAIDELQKKYPGYLSSLSLENSNTQQIADTINDKLIPALIARAGFMAVQDKINAQGKVLADAALKEYEVQKQINELNEKAKKKGYDVSDTPANYIAPIKLNKNDADDPEVKLRNQMADLKQAQQVAHGSVANVEDDISKLYQFASDTFGNALQVPLKSVSNTAKNIKKEISTVTNTGSSGKNTGTASNRAASPAGSETKTTTSTNDDIAKQADANAKEDLANLEKLHAQGLLSEEKYHDEVFDLQKKELEFKMTLYDEDSQQYKQLNADKLKLEADMETQKKALSLKTKDDEVTDATDNAKAVIDADKQALDSHKKTNQAYLDDTKKVYAQLKQNIQNHIDAIKGESTAELAEKKKLQKQLDAINKESAKNEVDTTKKIEDQKTKARTATVDEAKQLLNAVQQAFDEAESEELAAAGDNAQKKKEIQKKYALEKLIMSSATIIANTAESVAKTNAELGFPLAIPFDVLAIATGAVQEGIAIAQYNKIASMAKGGTIMPGKMGVIGGKPHSQGGTKFYGTDGTMFEAERGELLAVINRNSTEMLSRFSSLNQMGGGVSFFGGSTTTYAADGGLIARNVSAPVEQHYTMEKFGNSVGNAIKNMPPPVVRVQDVVYGINNRITRVDDRVNI